MRNVLPSLGIALVLGSSIASAAEPVGDYLVGDWVVGGTVNGQRATGSFTAKLAADGKCLLMQWEITADGNTSKGAGIGGIDPETGKPLEHGFTSDGDHWTNTYETVVGNQLGKFTGRRVGTVDGDPFDAEIQVNRTSNDRFTYAVNEAELVFEKKN